MNTLILRTVARGLMPLMLLFSIFALLRGHNEPGGGFVGGLAAAGAFALYAMAYNVQAAKDVLRLNPRTIVAVGLTLALVSGLVPMLMGRPFMTAQQVAIADASLLLSTPLLFDIGVYLVVVGTALTILINLAEE